MKRQRKSRWLVSSTGVVIVAAAFLLCGYGGLLGNKCTEIDVNSGRLRERTTFLGVTVSYSVTSTPFSQAVEKAGLSSQPADYRFACETRVGPQKLFGKSWPSTGYADAISSLNLLSKVLSKFPAQNENRNEMIANLLAMLKIGDHKGINRYVNELVDPVLEAEEARIHRKKSPD